MGLFSNIAKSIEAGKLQAQKDAANEQRYADARKSDMQDHVNSLQRGIDDLKRQASEAQRFGHNNHANDLLDAARKQEDRARELRDRHL